MRQQPIRRSYTVHVLNIAANVTAPTRHAAGRLPPAPVPVTTAKKINPTENRGKTCPWPRRRKR